MNPPLSQVERDMFHEVMTEIRHVRDSISSVHSALDKHVHDEDAQYTELRRDIKAVDSRVSNIEGDVKVLKTRWGIVASAAAMIGAAVMAALQRLFF